MNDDIDGKWIGLDNAFYHLIRPDFVVLMCIYLLLMRMKSAERSVFKIILTFFPTIYGPIINNIYARDGCLILGIVLLSLEAYWKVESRLIYRWTLVISELLLNCVTHCGAITAEEAATTTRRLNRWWKGVLIGRMKKYFNVLCIFCWIEWRESTLRHPS